MKFRTPDRGERRFMGVKVDVSLQATRTRNWSDTSYLPEADAAFIVSCQTLMATAPGDVQMFYTATNGDKVQLRAVQADRSVFQVGEDLPPQMPISVVSAPLPGVSINTNTLALMQAFAGQLGSIVTAAANTLGERPPS